MTRKGSLTALLEHRKIELRLHRTWTISRSSSDVKDNVLVRRSHAGIEGIGVALVDPPLPAADLDGVKSISPLVDYADLDGNLLIANDPFRGVRVKDGRLVLPDAPGLGLEGTW